MFTLKTDPYSFEAFISEKYKAEFDQWVVEKQQAALAAAWKKEQEEKPPFDLDEMEMWARFRVYQAAENSRHRYTLLGDGFEDAKDLGFVTLEGWTSYIRLTQSGILTLDGNGRLWDSVLPLCVVGGAGGSYAVTSDAGYVRVSDGNGNASWKKLAPDTARLGCFVVSPAHLPKFLVRFVRGLHE